MIDPDALALLGWNERVAVRGRGPLAAHPGATLARVTRTDRGLVSVLTSEGPMIAAAGPEPAATGDWVLLADDDDASTVVCVVPRFSAFVRGDPMDGLARNAQVLAANIDTVFVTQSFENGPNLRRLERELVLAFESGAAPVVVLTKADRRARPRSTSPRSCAPRRVRR